MSDTGAPSSSSSSAGVSALPARIAAWARTHKGPAAAAAAGLGVGGYALYKRHAASTAADTTAAGAAAADAAGTPIAGLSGNPDTTESDAANAFQDQINQLSDELDQKLAAPTAPAPAAPKDVGTGPQAITIQRGDTLASIAQRVYGSAAPWAIRELQIINPRFAGWKPTTSLTYYAGHSLIAPEAHPTFYATSHKLTAAQIAAQRANAEKNLKKSQGS